MVTGDPWWFGKLVISVVREWFYGGYRAATEVMVRAPVVGWMVVVVGSCVGAVPVVVGLLMVGGVMVIPWGVWGMRVRTLG